VVVPQLGAGSLGRFCGVEHEPAGWAAHAHAAVTWARDRQMERKAVVPQTIDLLEQEFDDLHNTHRAHGRRNVPNRDLDFEPRRSNVWVVCPGSGVPGHLDLHRVLIASSWASS